MGFQSNNTDHLTRSNLWSTEIKDILDDELMAIKYVRMLQDFPDGDTFNIPSIGQAQVSDYEEGQKVRYSSMDTGNFQFTIDTYLQGATFISNKYKQDSYLSAELISQFVPKHERAIMKVMEQDILSLGPEGQTASNTNSINGAYHRFVGGGTSEVIELADFAKAKYALDKANVAATQRIAIVDPSVAFTLATLSTLVNVSSNPRWEGIVRDGISTGMKFLMNVYGFDVYESQNLKSGIAETVNGLSVTTGVANLFFSAAQDQLPFVGAIRQPVKVDSAYNKDEQRDEYVLTTRYGFKLYRPENMVVVLTDTDQVYA